MSKFKFLEVGPRDGLQNESSIFSLADKIEFIKRLSSTGLERIEVGSFVSPKHLPQMKGTDDLVKEIFRLQKENKISPDVQFSALVPNRKGLERALSTGIKEIAIFAGCTDSFSKKNINCTVEESFKIYKALSKKAIEEGLKVRGYLSVAFGCPYEGKVEFRKVKDLTKKMEDMGIYEISISDTIGVAHPQQVESLLAVFHDISLKNIALHFHNVHGMALANILASYKMGVSSFDGSVGGLGGCPYVGTSSGNVPSEEIFYLLEGPDHPILKKLTEISVWLEGKLKKSLPSLVSASPYYRVKKS